ncbi:MAG: hypothetical protein R3C45_18355 [Phycisphaerales bacterium]
MAPKAMICPLADRRDGDLVTRPDLTGSWHKSTDPRILALAIHSPEYKGRTIRAVVLEDGQGFECDGERFRR